MKLPEDKNERKKVLVLIGMGAVFALYGCVAGILNPIMRVREEKRASIEEISGQLEKAQLKIDQMNKSRRQNVDTLSRILAISETDDYVLQPRLGNYLLGAREYIERHSRKAGVPVDSIREIGISQLPQAPGNSAEHAVNAYTVSVGLQCGLHDLVRLLKRIESDNPYLAVSSLAVAGQAKTPGSHGVRFELQWPVWANPETPTELAAELDALQNPGGKPAESGMQPATEGGEE